MSFYKSPCLSGKPFANWIAAACENGAHGRTGLPLLPESIPAFQISACSGRLQRSGLPAATL
jgi:hypothetical protein